MDYDASRKKWEEALEMATKEMCKTLNSFGPTATLNLLVSLSNQDRIVDGLLPLFPSIVATGDFLSGISTCEVEKEEENEEDE
jgi:hypothetical protein